MASPPLPVCSLMSTTSIRSTDRGRRPNPLYERRRYRHALTDGPAMAGSTTSNPGEDAVLFSSKFTIPTRIPPNTAPSSSRSTTIGSSPRPSKPWIPGSPWSGGPWTEPHRRRLPRGCLQSRGAFHECASSTPSPNTGSRSVTLVTRATVLQYGHQIGPSKPCMVTGVDRFAGQR